MRVVEFLVQNEPCCSGELTDESKH
jgi:hypothetical protein